VDGRNQYFPELTLPERHRTQTVVKPCQRRNGSRPPSTLLLICVLVVAVCSPIKAQELVGVRLSLAGQTIKDRLPFDRPFLLVGTTSSTVMVIKGAYADTVRECPDLSEELPAGWGGLASWQRVAAMPNDSFAVYVPALDAGRTFTFCFRLESKLDAPKLEAFRAEVANDLDLTFRERIPGGSQGFTTSERQELQTAILAALPSPEGGRFEYESGSIFDRNATGNELEEALRGLRWIKSSQGNREEAIDNFNGTASALESTLRALAGDAQLAALEANESRALPAAAVELVASINALGANEAARIAAGQDALRPRGQTATATAPPDLQDAWVETDLTGRIANLRQTATALQVVRRAIPVSSAGVGESTDSPAAGQQSIRALLETAEEAALAEILTLEGMGRILDRRSSLIEAAAASLRTEAESEVRIVSSTSGNFDTRASWYFSLDIGLAWAPVLDETLPYVGVNIYTRPVDKEVPLSAKGGFGRRFAFVLGITTGSVAKTGERDDLIGGQALLVGGGLRVTDATRLTAGALVFKGDDPNPLVTDFGMTTALFLAISLDADVKELLGGVGKAIAGG
jgi:hypothetical protein